MHSYYRTRSRPAQAASCLDTRWQLFYGDSRTSLAQIIPDLRYPDMYRIKWPDRSVSDLANIVRVKDAAMAIVARGPPARNWRRLHWERSKTLPEAPPACEKPSIHIPEPASPIEEHLSTGGWVS